MERGNEDEYINEICKIEFRAVEENELLNKLERGNLNKEENFALNNIICTR